MPDNPDSKVFEQFLIGAKFDDPVQFPDLSVAVIKLLGQVSTLRNGQATVWMPVKADGSTTLRFTLLPNCVCSPKTDNLFSPTLTDTGA